MKITKQARREAKQLFKSCMSAGVLDESRAGQIARELVQAKPRNFLAILTHFHRLVKLEVERRNARVESAGSLGEDLKARVRQSLTDAYGPGLNITFGENPALIGGVRIQVGSDVYDGSVRAKLSALEESFS